jgi:hypothetical protein
MDTVDKTPDIDTIGDSLRARLRMVTMMEAIAALPRDEADQFVRAVLMVGSCFLNEKDHGVFLFVENEDTLKVMGVHASLEETEHIVNSAAEIVINNAVAKELHRRGETH